MSQAKSICLYFYDCIQWKLNVSVNMTTAMPRLIVFLVSLWRVNMSVHVALVGKHFEIQKLCRYTSLITSSNVSQRLIGFIWSVGYNSHLAFHLFTPKTNSSSVWRSVLNMKFILFKFAEIDQCQ